MLYNLGETFEMDISSSPLEVYIKFINNELLP